MYQGVRNISFFGNFAYVVNESSAKSDLGFAYLSLGSSHNSSTGWSWSCVTWINEIIFIINATLINLVVKKHKKIGKTIKDIKTIVSF